MPNTLLVCTHHFDKLYICVNISGFISYIDSDNDETEEYVPGEEEEDELEQENEGDILNAAEHAQIGQEAKEIAEENKELELQEQHNQFSDLALPHAPKKRRVSQAAGLFTVNEQQTRQICNFCPKSYSGGRNSKNTGTHSIVKHLKSAHAGIPQVAAAFDLVAEPKAVERR